MLAGGGVTVSRGHASAVARGGRRLTENTPPVYRPTELNSIVYGLHNVALLPLNLRLPYRFKPRDAAKHQTARRARAVLELALRGRSRFRVVSAASCNSFVSRRVFQVHSGSRRRV